MSFEGKIATIEKHNVGSGCIVLEKPPGASLRGSQTNFAFLPPSYDGHHASLTPNMVLQARAAHATVQKYSIQGQLTLHRRSPRPFPRSSLPEDGMSEGVALQPGEERETVSNAAWKKQVREDRLALNALVEANQGREANAVPDDGGNGEDLSAFNTRYQEYLGRRGLSNIEQLTRHTEMLFDEL